MRTTLTLDDDVARAIEVERRRHAASLKVTVNRLLRIGLQSAAAPPGAKAYRTRVRSLGLRPGLDAAKLNQLVDELEVVEHRRRQGRLLP